MLISKADASMTYEMQEINKKTVVNQSRHFKIYMRTLNPYL